MHFIEVDHCGLLRSTSPGIPRDQSSALIQHKHIPASDMTPVPTAVARIGRIAPVCLRSLNEEALRRRIDSSILFHGLGFVASDLDKPGFSVSRLETGIAIRRALLAMDDAELGMSVGMRTKITSRGVLALGLLGSPTLGEAIDLEMRFPSSAGELLSVRDERSLEADTLVAEPRVSELDIGSFLVDRLFAGCVKMRRQMTKVHYSPLRVELVRARPPSAAAFEKYYGCSVAFGSLSNRLVSELSWMSFSLPLASRAAYQQSVDLLEREDWGDLTMSATALAVERMILRLLPNVTGPAEMASALNMSERSMRRQLAQQGESYSQLLDDCRKLRALELLVVGRRSVQEVAEQTGFANVQNFRRAFKRWTGAKVGDAGLIVAASSAS